MLYVFHGSDGVTARAKVSGLVGQLLAKKPDALSMRINEEDYEPNQLDELAFGQALFEQRYIVIFDKVFTNKEHKEHLLDRIKDVALSENIFILLEDVLDAKAKKKLEKHAAKITEYTKKEAAKKQESFNTFALSDAFGARDKKSLWVLYQKATENNVSAEEIHGILFWLLKSMILSAESSNAAEAGLKPFVYTKASRFAGNFSESERRTLAQKLVSMYHDARMGKSDFSVSLERFILGL